MVTLNLFLIINNLSVQKASQYSFDQGIVCAQQEEVVRLRHQLWIANKKLDAVEKRNTALLNEIRQSNIAAVMVREANKKLEKDLRTMSRELWEALNKVNALRRRLSNSKERSEVGQT